MTYVAIVIGKRGKKKYYWQLPSNLCWSMIRQCPRDPTIQTSWGQKEKVISIFCEVRLWGGQSEYRLVGHPSVFPQHFFTGWEYGVTEHTAYKNSRLVKSPYIGCFHTIWVLVAVYPLFLSSISNPILFRACLTINTRSHLIIIGPGEEYPGLMFTWIFLENMFNSQF